MATTESLYGDRDPTGTTVADDLQPVELGTAFRASRDGRVLGVRFWKTPANRGEHVGSLWSSLGERLASATFAEESAEGWQTVRFERAVAIAAGQTYVASYHAPNGAYASTTDVDEPASSASLSTVGPGAGGVYSYGEQGTFPTQSWQSSSYWVDVEFRPEPGPAPQDPATAPPSEEPAESPSPGAPTISGPFAGASNTGPAAAGFAPTAPYTGPMTVTEDGTVITNSVIPAGLRIEADDVTVQGNLITGPTEVEWDQAAIHVTGERVRIVDNEIRGESATDWRLTPVSGVKLVGADPEFSRNDLHLIAGDGVSIYGEGAQVIGNWVHDFVARGDGVHYDGLHYPGDRLERAARVADNTVEMWVLEAGTSGMTAALGLPAYSPELVAEHNALAGGNYALYGGGYGTRIAGNLFWTKFSPDVGYFGTHAYVGEDVEWSGNAYSDDGVTSGAPLAY
ncbi:DUF4082 domain-containing protein [Agromyces sp. NPDC057679]|uniref:DUF4082 domain-containing protein n=1 Tax=Agromyces sp. NPDC057679 TaxID=3346207 RepID=UPI00366AC5C9